MGDQGIYRGFCLLIFPQGGAFDSQFVEYHLSHTSSLLGREKSSIIGALLHWTAWKLIASLTLY